jgi:hypothetical protein
MNRLPGDGIVQPLTDGKVSYETTDADGDNFKVNFLICRRLAGLHDVATQHVFYIGVFHFGEGYSGKWGIRRSFGFKVTYWDPFGSCSYCVCLKCVPKGRKGTTAGSI